MTVVTSMRIAAGVAGLALLAPALVRAQEPVDARAFVRRQYVHGVPYEAALRLPAGSQEVLVALLNAPQERRWWANAVQTLGAIGDQSVGRVLVGFIRRGEDAMTGDVYNAKTTAIFSLGWWLNRNADATIVDFLRAGLTPRAWSDRVEWRSPYTQDRSEQNDRLAFASMRALGISGRLEAATALTAVRDRGLDEFTSELRETAQSVLTEAMRVNEEVRTRGGLRAYLAGAGR